VRHFRGRSVAPCGGTVARFTQWLTWPFTSHTLDEWQECRTTIGRCDSILADIRKYGFALVTVLLTANALITTANPVADHVAASSVVIVLLLVLFLMDRYWWVLLKEASTRAIILEGPLHFLVTAKLTEGAHRVHNTNRGDDRLRHLHDRGRRGGGNHGLAGGLGNRRSRTRRGDAGRCCHHRGPA